MLEHLSGLTSVFAAAMIFIPKIVSWAINKRNVKKLARMAKYLGFQLKSSKGGLLYLVADTRFGYHFQARFKGAFDSRAKVVINGLKEDPEISYMVEVEDYDNVCHYETKSMVNPFFEKTDEQIALMLDLSSV